MNVAGRRAGCCVCAPSYADESGPCTTTLKYLRLSLYGVALMPGAVTHRASAQARAADTRAGQCGARTHTHPTRSSSQLTWLGKQPLRLLHDSPRQSIWVRHCVPAPRMRTGHGTRCVAQAARDAARGQRSGLAALARARERAREAAGAMADAAGDYLGCRGARSTVPSRRGAERACHETRQRSAKVAAQRRRQRADLATHGTGLADRAPLPECDTTQATLARRPAELPCGAARSASSSTTEATRASSASPGSRSP